MYKYVNHRSISISQYLMNNQNVVITQFNKHNTTMLKNTLAAVANVTSTTGTYNGTFIPPSLTTLLHQKLSSSVFVKVKLFSTSSNCNPNSKNHYEVLNISQSATNQEVRDAFLKLSKEFHPDIKGNDSDNHQNFINVNEAYTILIKPISRRDYDIGLKGGIQQSTHPPSRGYSYDYETFYNHQYKKDPRYSTGEETSSKRLAGISLNFYTVSTAITVGFVWAIMYFKEIIVPDVNSKKSVTASQMNEKDYIMTTYHEGKPVHYYAVKDTINPEVYKIFAVMKKELTNNGQSDSDHEYEVQMEDTTSTSCQ